MLTPNGSGGRYVVLMCGLNIRSQNRIAEPEQRVGLDTVANDLDLVRMVGGKGTYLVTSAHPSPRVADLAIRTLSSYRQDLKISGAAVLTPDTLSAGLAELSRVLRQRYGTRFDSRDHGVIIDEEPWRAGLALPVRPGEISAQRSVFDKLTNAMVLGWAHGCVLVVKREAHNIHWGTTVTDPSERRLRRLEGVVVKLT